MKQTNDKKLYEGIYKLSSKFSTNSISLQGKEIASNTTDEIKSIVVITKVPVRISACTDSEIIITPKNLPKDQNAFDVSIQHSITKHHNTLYIKAIYYGVKSDASLSIEIPAKPMGEPYSELSIKATDTKVEVDSFVSVENLCFDGENCEFISKTSFKSVDLTSKNCSITLQTIAKNDIYFNAFLIDSGLNLALHNIGNCEELNFETDEKLSYSVNTLGVGTYKAFGQIEIHNS